MKNEMDKTITFSVREEERDRERKVLLRAVYDALPEVERKKNYPLQLPSMPQLRKIARIDAVYNLSDADQGGHFDDSVGVVSDWRRAGFDILSFVL